MHIEQTAEQQDERYWKWSIWIEGTKQELGSIAKVVYHLHPTYKKPIVERTNSRTKFRLNSSGWGTFVVKADLHLKDGSVRQMRHRLRFSRAEPKVFVSSAARDTRALDHVRDAVSRLHIGVETAADVEPGEDPASTIQQSIDQAKAYILLDGDTPNRWVMEEMAAARALGKRIISIGPAPYYDTEGALQLDSVAELEGALEKLPE